MNIAQALEKSGELPKALLSQYEEVLLHAHQQGLAIFKVDCSKARNLSALLRAFAKAVDYPVFFGKDTDALLDCLSETLDEQKKGYLLWIQSFHSGDPDLAQDAQKVLSVLKEASQYANDKQKVLTYIVEHSGKHSAPEPGIAPAPYAESLLPQ